MGKLGSLRVEKARRALYRSDASILVVDDEPGDYRPTGVAYQPMEWTADINSLTDPNPRVIYYDDATARYYQNDGTNGWQEVQGSRLQKILDDKAYIDMPNLTYFTFLNPRNVFMGLTLTYHF